MKKTLFLLSLFLIISCEDDAVQNEVVEETNIPDPIEVVDVSLLPITQVSFEASKNNTLEEDIVLNFDGKNTFSGLVPMEADIYNMVPTFETEDEGVVFYMDNEPVQNGVTPKDFSKEVVVMSENADQSATSVYLVRLTYDTGLPSLHINIEGDEFIDYEDFGNKYYYNANLTLNGGLNFDDIESTDIKIRGRGNSSWWQGTIWGKKPYQIEFFDQKEVLGMPSDRRWVLLSELSDKTMIRNRISYFIGSLSHLDYTPTGNYVDLFVNGQPQGTYLMAQKVEDTKSRLDIGPTGYLLEVDQVHRVREGDVYYDSSVLKKKVLELTNGNFGHEIVLNIKSPIIQYDSPEYNNLKNKIEAFESALFGENFENSQLGYRAHIDVASFVDWYIIQEIAKSVDARWYSSIFFNYVPGKKFRMGPLWDFDLSYGNVNYADSQFYEGYWIQQNPWMSRLFQDPYFANQVRDRFQFYYSRLPEILSKIDAFAQHLEASQQKNYDIWPTLGEYVWPNPVFYPTYQEEVDHLKWWLTERMNWLNSNL